MFESELNQTKITLKSGKADRECSFKSDEAIQLPEIDSWIPVTVPTISVREFLHSTFAELMTKVNVKVREEEAKWSTGGGNKIACSAKLGQGGGRSVYEVSNLDLKRADTVLR